MENVEFTFGKGVNLAWCDSAARKATILSNIWFIYAELIPLNFFNSYENNRLSITLPH